MRGLASVSIGLASVLGLVACTHASDIASGPEASDSPTSSAVVSPPLDVPEYAGCSETGQSSDGKRAELHVAWRHQATPVSRPRIVGGCAVVYVRHGRDLAITALDPKTGESLWEAPATPGGTPPGVSLSVAKVEDAGGREFVAYLSPVLPREPYARLVVVNPADGVVSSTDEQVGLFVTYPSPCTNELDVCVDGLVDPGSGSSMTSYRLSLPGDHLDVVPSGVGGRTLGDGGLVDSGARDPELLARVDGRSVLWSRPIAELFGDGATTDLGWVFSHDAGKGLYVGSVGNEQMRERGQLYPGRSATAAFDDEAGRRLWIDRHSYFGCNGTMLLPQPRRGDEEASGDGSAYPVRCRYDGHADGKSQDFSGVRVSIEGFDVETGRTRWSYAVRPSDQLGLAAPGLPRIRHTSVLVRGTDGLRVLDLASGKTRKPGTNDVFLCTDSPLLYRGSVPFDAPGQTIYKRVFDGVFVLCDTHGNPSDRVPDPEVMEVEGAQDDGSWILSTPHAVVAYRAAAS